MAHVRGSFLTKKCEWFGYWDGKFVSNWYGGTLSLLAYVYTLRNCSFIQATYSRVYTRAHLGLFTRAPTLVCLHATRQSHQAEPPGRATRQSLEITSIVYTRCQYSVYTLSDSAYTLLTLAGALLLLCAINRLDGFHH